MLFDTTFVIDWAREARRRRPDRASAFLQQHPNIAANISIITVAEFAEGYEPADEAKCWEALSRYAVIDIETAIAWRAGQISRDLRSRREIIGDNDIWIAATAMHHGFSGVSKNAKHFRRVSGLQVIDY